MNTVEIFRIYDENKLYNQINNRNSKTKHNIREDNPKKHQQWAITAVKFGSDLDRVQSQTIAQLAHTYTCTPSLSAS